MSLQLFGFDCIPDDTLFGLWIIDVTIWKKYDSIKRSLFSLYYSDGEWIFNLCFFNIKGE